MSLRIVLSALLCWLGAAAGRADVTIRYSLEIKPGSMLPPQAAQAMKAQMPANNSVTTQVKGNKAYGNMMGITAITDFERGTITILDPKAKRFATANSGEFAAAVSKNAELPPEARKKLEAMKLDVQSRVTGRTEVIREIGAEEREIVFTMEFPAGTPGSPGTIRAVYALWAPTSAEIARRPDLREFAQYTRRAYAGMNPADMMQKMFAQMPGLGEKLKDLTEESRKLAVILRLRGAVYVPGMAAMIEQLRKAGKPTPEGFDPNGTMMEFAMDLVELSTAEIPAAVFEVPKDYTAAPIQEVLKSAMPARPGSPPQ